jgi:large subunit ribosomal protein L17
MRHKNIRTRLNRDSSNRMSMLNNMCVSLVQHEQIETTLTKAKVLRRYIEPLITIAKNGNGDLPSIRRLSNILPEYEAVTKLIKVLAVRYAKRPGGYTRIARSGFRKGDGAPTAYIELVDRDKTAKGANMSSTEANKKSVKK